MNRSVFSLILQAVVLYFIQVLIFNELEIGSYIKFYPYFAFVLVYPLRKNRLNLLIISFIFGLLIDFSQGTGGINAMSLCTVAFLRLPILKFILGSSDIDYPNFNLRQIPLDKALIYIFILCIIFHLSLYSLSYFSSTFLRQILLHGLLSSLATFVLTILGVFTLTKPR